MLVLQDFGDEHLLLLLDQKPVVDSRQEITMLPGDSETGSVGSDARRKYLEGPLWVGIQILECSDRSRTSFWLQMMVASEMNGR